MEEEREQHRKPHAKGSLFLPIEWENKHLFNTSLNIYKLKGHWLSQYDAYLRGLGSDFFFYCLHNPFTDIANIKLLLLTKHIKNTDDLTRINQQEVCQCFSYVISLRHISEMNRPFQEAAHPISHPAVPCHLHRLKHKLRKNLTWRPLSYPVSFGIQC